MHISPDDTVFWQCGALKINATLAFSWAVMAVMAVAAKLATRRLTLDLRRARWQNVMESVVLAIEKQIRDVGLRNPDTHFSFLGTLFLFIATANLFTVFPGYKPPTASLSTTAALALCVFAAVPASGIVDQGLRGYLRSYVEPTVIMLPFNVISDFSRTLALAVRLFGNMMSGEMIVGILLTITPLLFPVVMTVLGLLTGMVQAYIFSVLAAVYIAAAQQADAPASEAPHAA